MKSIIKPLKRIRIKDIAEKAKVSIGTVDRVIHNRGEVSPATKELILKIIKEMDYQPNIIASTLASKKVYRFAIFIPEPISEEAYWNKPLVGIKRAFQEIQQYGVEISTYQFKQNDPSSYSTTSKMIMENKPDGVVLAPFFSRESGEFIQQLQNQKIPFVFIDSNFPDCDKISFIGQNSYQSGALAAKLFNFSLPEKASILVIHFAKEMDNQNHLVQREKGFYKYFKDNDPKEYKSLITLEITNPTDKSYYKELDNAFKKNTDLKGVFVTNSQGYRVAQYLNERKIEGIRLIGHDLIKENIQFVKNETIDFLICQRPEEQGFNAVNTLFQHIILKKEVQKEKFTSIDIVTKENIDYYKEFN
ncbi:substrate-binding domain-containing protein [Sunxiuqinia sp. A32]|uniref:substrate-binding domain-containing protein n=1 Tax=Sunxiuqinia sp. A32 TaxID=3461496 RepID=UPI004045E0EB